MIVYRAVKAKRANDLSGYGASLAGGRWNHKGTSVIYTSGTPELALLELTVHLDAIKIPKSIVITEIEIDSRSFIQMDPSTLKSNWPANPYPNALPDFGTQWVDSQRSLVLKVPSAIMPLSFNYIINPRHVDITKVKVTAQHPVNYDPRLKK